jgi:hypothetical protein
MGENKMIKLLDILKEEQKFNFESSKDEILSYIKNKKAKYPYLWPFEKTIYSIIRNAGGSKVGASLNLGFTTDEINKWRTIFKSSIFNTGGGPWSQVDFNPQLARKTGKDRTLNFYITLVKTKDNILNFVKAVPDLNKKLKEFSDTKQSPISWKTHNYLDMFVGDNDSLKVYYYDADLKDDVEKIIKDWASKNNIKLSNRTHSHGVDMKTSPDHESKSSFGEILSQEITKQFDALIEKHGNKYTDEQYYEWIKKYGPEIIKKVTIKYK